MALLEYEPRQTLYHYCSPEGFRGIVTSRTLWFSDLEALNDPREITLGYEHFLAALKEIRHIEFMGSRGMYLSVLAGKLATLRAGMKAYNCSFSLVGDSLPLWGEYTRHAGLSIGFRPTALHDIQGRVQKAQYLDASEAEAFRAKALEIAGQLLGDGERPSQVFWVQASVAAFAAVTALKHESWSHEREIRMVFIQHKRPLAADEQAGLGLDGEEELPWIEPLMRVREGREVAYFAFPFGRYRDEDKRHARAIQEVIIGPRCSMSEDEVRALLAEHGYVGVDIRRSGCLIR